MGKAENDKKAMEGRARKAAYLKRKTLVLEREKTNYDRIILCHDRENWWKIFDHSSIFYRKLVAERLKKNVIAYEDKDFGVKSDELVVNIRSLEELKEDVSKLKMEIDPKNNEDFFAVILPEKVTEEEFQLFKNETRAELEMALRQLRPVVIWPKLKKEILALLMLMDWMCGAMDEGRRMRIGNKMYENVRQIFLHLVKAAKEREDAMTALIAMMELTEEVEGDFMILTSGGWPKFKPDKAAEVGKAIKDMKSSINREMGKEQKKQVTVSNEGSKA